MDYGMKNRMAGILSPKSGRCVMLAVDHGYFQGPTTGLERPRDVVAPLLPYADSLMLTRGVLRTSVDPGVRVPIVLRMSGGTSVLKEDLSNEDITVSMEDAIRCNASALALSVFVGSANERQTLTNLAKLCDDGQKYGIPVLAVTAVGKEMVRDARYLGLATRICAELGANVVKTYHCEGFEKVVNGCPVPVVIAGGKKIEERDALKLAYSAIKDGAAGVDMGRNIFQSRWPVQMIRAVRMIVHEGLTDEQAWTELQKMIGCGQSNASLRRDRPRRPRRHRAARPAPRRARRLHRSPRRRRPDHLRRPSQERGRRDLHRRRHPPRSRDPRRSEEDRARRPLRRGRRLRDPHGLARPQSVPEAHIASPKTTRERSIARP
jgi:putative autoinducer-2 (AI-2) aldolase